MLEPGTVKGTLAAPAGGTWRPWTIWLPCALAICAAGLCVVGAEIGLVMGSWDTPMPGLWWLKAGAIGQCVLAVITAVVLGVGVQRSRWRRAAVIIAWVIIPLEFALLLLTGRLSSGS